MGAVNNQMEYSNKWVILLSIWETKFNEVANCINASSDAMHAVKKMSHNNAQYEFGKSLHKKNKLFITLHHFFFVCVCWGFS